MEQKSQQTDQQATNAALAALAATGNDFALGQLWEVNKGFLHQMFWKWYDKTSLLLTATASPWKILTKKHSLPCKPLRRLTTREKAPSQRFWAIVCRRR